MPIQETFDFADKRVFVRMDELPADAQYTLERFFEGPQADPGMGKLAVLARVVDKLTIEGKSYDIEKILKRGGKRASSRGVFPKLWDREEGKSILDALMEFAVWQDPWLAEVEPYAEHFAEFLPEDEGERPTILRLASGSPTD